MATVWRRISRINVSLNTKTEDCFYKKEIEKKTQKSNILDFEEIHETVHGIFV